MNTKLTAIRTALADYIRSEGCDCCSNRDEHKEAARQLAGLPTNLSAYQHFQSFRRPTKPERDSQRSKLYKAENVLKHHQTIKFKTVRDVEQFIETQVLKSRALQSRYGHELCRTIVVGDGRRRSNAGGDEYGIYMPLWSRTPFVILHEIAHTITIRRHGSKISGHGREYAAVLLDLVKYVLGVDRLR